MPHNIKINPCIVCWKLAKWAQCWWTRAQAIFDWKSHVSSVLSREFVSWHSGFTSTFWGRCASVIYIFNFFLTRRVNEGTGTRRFGRLSFVVGLLVWTVVRFSTRYCLVVNVLIGWWCENRGFLGGLFEIWIKIKCLNKIIPKCSYIRILTLTNIYFFVHNKLNLYFRLIYLICTIQKQINTRF